MDNAIQTNFGCYHLLNAVQKLVTFLSLKSAYKDQEKADVLKQFSSSLDEELCSSHPSVMFWECPAHNAVTVVCNKDFHKWVLATRDLDTCNVPITALTTSLDALLADSQHFHNTSKAGQVD